MTKRIDDKFESLKKEGRSALVTYIMACDPDYETSLKILKELPKSGADIIELGLAFADPMADGPTIEAASVRALSSGFKLSRMFEMVIEFRKTDNTTPIIVMGYYNPILNYGLEEFTKKAKESGIDGFLIVDLPPEEDEELFNITKKEELSLIKLATPTTDKKRLQKIVSKASGFLYYVAVAGITGSKSASYESIKNAVNEIKESTDLPIAVGFGIKTPESVKEIAKYSDAVVVGSALVNKINESPEESLSFVKDLRNAL